MVRKLTRLSILLSVILLTFSAAAMAASDGDEDKTSFIMHHVKDSHEWHFATIGHTHVTLSLPVIIYSSDRGIEFYSSSSFVDPETHHFGVEHNGYYIDDHDKLKAVDESRFFIDLSITKNVAMLFLILAVTLYLTLSASGYYKSIQTKHQEELLLLLSQLFFLSEMKLQSLILVRSTKNSPLIF